MVAMQRCLSPHCLSECISDGQLQGIVVPQAPTCKEIDWWTQPSKKPALRTAFLPRQKLRPSGYVAAEQIACVGSASAPRSSGAVAGNRFFPDLAVSSLTKPKAGASSRSSSWTGFLASDQSASPGPSKETPPIQNEEAIAAQRFHLPRVHPHPVLASPWRTAFLDGLCPGGCKDKLVLSLIEVFGLGLLGIDRMYLGSWVTGLLKLVTGGGGGIWALVDWMVIIDNGLMSRQSIDFLAMKATFEPSTISSAHMVSVVYVLLLVANCLLGFVMQTASGPGPGGGQAEMRPPPPDAVEVVEEPR